MRRLPPTFHPGPLTYAQAEALNQLARDLYNSLLDHFSAAPPLQVRQGQDGVAFSLGPIEAGASGIITRKNSGTPDFGPRRRLNLIEGTNIVLGMADDPTDNEIDITITATAPAGVGIEVKEADGTPDYTGISTLIFDQDDGFVVSQPAAGQAKINLKDPNCWPGYEEDLVEDQNDYDPSPLKWWRLRAWPGYDATLSASQNNYNPTLLSWWRLTSTLSTVTLTGLAARAGGESVLISNAGNLGDPHFELLNEDGSSTAVNRIVTPGGTPFAVEPRTAVLLTYDAGLSRWAVITSIPDDDPPNVDITGIMARDDGCPLLISNVGALGGATLSLTHEDALSTADNRILTSDGRALVLDPTESVLLRYDTVALRWRVLLVLEAGAGSEPDCWEGYDADFDASANNYGPSPKKWWRLDRSDTPADATITGIVARGDGCPLLISNVGILGTGGTLSLTHEDAASTDANQILTSDGATLALQPGESVLLRYDTLVERWRVLLVLGAGATSGDPNCWEGYDVALDTNANDYDPSPLKWWELTRGSSPTNVDITGIVARDDGCPILITHQGLTGGGATTNTITLKGTSTASVLANRFAEPVDIVLKRHDSVLLRYDVALSRWRVLRYPAASLTQAGLVSLANQTMGAGQKYFNDKVGIGTTNPLANSALDQRGYSYAYFAGAISFGGGNTPAAETDGTVLQYSSPDVTLTMPAAAYTSSRVGGFAVRGSSGKFRLHHKTASTRGFGYHNDDTGTDQDGITGTWNQIITQGGIVIGGTFVTGITGSF